MNNMEERLLSVERRLRALLNILPDDWKEKVEREKDRMIDEEGYEYTISAIIETDKGDKSIKFKVKAWSEKQALYLANDKVIYPQMSRLQSEGKIRFFKTKHKQIV
jgi:hypothetical protein